MALPFYRVEYVFRECQSHDFLVISKFQNQLRRVTALAVICKANQLVQVFLFLYKEKFVDFWTKMLTVNTQYVGKMDSFIH